MGILGNMDSQWGPFLHPAHHSKTTPVGGNPREMGNEIRKKNMLSLLYLALKRTKKLNDRHLNIRIVGNDAKKK